MSVNAIRVGDSIWTSYAIPDCHVMVNQHVLKDATLWGLEISTFPCKSVVVG
jgi:hypothetical protein